MAEIFAHLDDSRRPVSLPLDLQGTAFQLQVWQALRQIPVGETRSYRRGRAYWPAAGSKSRGRRLRGEFAGGDCSLPPGGA